jgi:hypothetical protein
METNPSSAALADTHEFSKSPNAKICMLFIRITKSYTNMLSLLPKAEKLSPVWEGERHCH